MLSVFLSYMMVSVILYYVNTSFMFKINGRMPFFSNLDEKWWQETVDVFKLLRHDLMQIHCPWSWKRAVYYRVTYAHTLLQHMKHEKGWRPEDCHNPHNYEQIAKDCFVSRKKFWSLQILYLVAAPILFFPILYLSLKSIGM